MSDKQRLGPSFHALDAKVALLTIKALADDGEAHVQLGGDGAVLELNYQLLQGFHPRITGLPIRVLHPLIKKGFRA